MSVNHNMFIILYYLLIKHIAHIYLLYWLTSCVIEQFITVILEYIDVVIFGLVCLVNMYNLKFLLYLHFLSSISINSESNDSAK